MFDLSKLFPTTSLNWKTTVRTNNDSALPLVVLGNWDIMIESNVHKYLQCNTNISEFMTRNRSTTMKSTNHVKFYPVLVQTRKIPKPHKNLIFVFFKIKPRFLFCCRDRDETGLKKSGYYHYYVCKRMNE